MNLNTGNYLVRIKKYSSTLNINLPPEYIHKMIWPISSISEVMPFLTNDTLVPIPHTYLFSVNNDSTLANIGGYVYEFLDQTNPNNVLYSLPYNNNIKLGISVLGIKENLSSIQNKSNSNFEAYPNPTENFVNIHLNENIESLASISIYNSIGEEIFKTKYSNLSSTAIDVSHLNNGIYLMQVVTNISNAYTYKFIKL